MAARQLHRYWYLRLLPIALLIAGGAWAVSSQVPGMTVADGIRLADGERPLPEALVEDGASLTLRTIVEDERDGHRLRLRTIGADMVPGPHRDVALPRGYRAVDWITAAPHELIGVFVEERPEAGSVVDLRVVGFDTRGGHETFAIDGPGGLPRDHATLRAYTATDVASGRHAVALTFERTAPRDRGARGGILLLSFDAAGRLDGHALTRADLGARSGRSGADLFVDGAGRANLCLSSGRDVEAFTLAPAGYELQRRRYRLPARHRLLACGWAGADLAAAPRLVGVAARSGLLRTTQHLVTFAPETGDAPEIAAAPLWPASRGEVRHAASLREDDGSVVLAFERVREVRVSHPKSQYRHAETRVGDILIAVAGPGGELAHVEEVSRELTVAGGLASGAGLQLLPSPRGTSLLYADAPDHYFPSGGTATPLLPSYLTIARLVGDAGVGPRPRGYVVDEARGGADQVWRSALQSTRLGLVMVTGAASETVAGQSLRLVYADAVRAAGR